MRCNLQPSRAKLHGRYVCGLMFSIFFCVATHVEADYVFVGNMKPGCSETGQCKVATVAPGISPSKPDTNSKAVVYLNLANAITKSSQGNYPKTQGISSAMNSVTVSKKLPSSSSTTTTASPQKTQQILQSQPLTVAKLRI